MKNQIMVFMKNLLIILISAAAVLASSRAMAQANNYVRSWTIKRPGIVTVDAVANLTDPPAAEQPTVYYAGLGRPVQRVSKQASPMGNDLVAPHVYDQFGREATRYLPYAASSNDGNYRPNALTEQNVFNSIQFPGEQYYYARTDFEPSPSRRPVASYAAGISGVGAGRGKTISYLMNTADDSVEIWNIDPVAGSIPTSAGAYPVGELYKTADTDEHQHMVIEYKDKEGHVVLKKVQLWDTPAAGHSGWLCTYYIYDDLDNLRFVIQPKAVIWLQNNNWNFSNGGGGTVTNELCFRYEYDSRKRMIIRKVPGAGEVRMIYDRRDRLVMSQDSVQRSQQK